MRGFLKFLFCAVAFVFTGAPTAYAGEHCQPEKGITPYCGLQGPEDMVHVPDSSLLILSQYGGHMQHGPGSLLLFDMATEDKTELFSSSTIATQPSELWGDSNCTVPPKHFSPHGIDMILWPDGALMLLVVNHEEADSVQFFQIIRSGNDAALEWRGCVMMPVGLKLNDVSATPEGGFVTGAVRIKEMRQTRWTSLDEVVPQLMRWSPSEGLTIVHAFPSGGYLNGVNVAASGDTVFVNDSALGKVSKISLKTGEILREAFVKTPDNNRWTGDGRLLITSILVSDMAVMEECDRHKDKPCAIPFSVSVLDPDTMQIDRIFYHDGSQPFGAATVALQVGDKLYLGAALGDRMAMVPMPQNRKGKTDDSD